MIKKDWIIKIIYLKKYARLFNSFQNLPILKIDPKIKKDNIYILKLKIILLELTKHYLYYKTKST